MRVTQENKEFMNNQNSIDRRSEREERYIIYKKYIKSKVLGSTYLDRVYLLNETLAKVIVIWLFIETRNFQTEMQKYETYH